MHYANGREAKVGDLVVGTAYNMPAEYGKDLREVGPKRLVGTLVKVVQGSERCNAEIEWVESVDVPPDGFPLRPSMAQGDPRFYFSAGLGQRAHFLCRDYTHCGALLHVEDVVQIERLASDGSYVPHGKAA